MELAILVIATISLILLITIIVLLAGVGSKLLSILSILRNSHYFETHEADRQKYLDNLQAAVKAPAIPDNKTTPESPTSSRPYKPAYETIIDTDRHSNRPERIN